MNKVLFYSNLIMVLVTFGACAHAMEEEVSDQLAHMSVQQKNPNDSLLDAIEANDCEAAEKAINEGVDLNNLYFCKDFLCDKDYSTPLGVAMAKSLFSNTSRLELITLFLKNGANPDIFGINGEKKMSTLYHVVEPGMAGLQNDSYPIFKCLLQYGAKENNMTQDQLKNYYHSLLDIFVLCLSRLDRDPSQDSVTKGCLKKGLLTLNLFDEKNSRLDAAMEISECNSSIKNFILEGKGRHLSLLKKLDKEIKKDLEYREDLYQLSRLPNKSYFKIVMGSQLTGSLSLCKWKHNAFFYGGREYFLSQKRFNG